MKNFYRNILKKSFTIVKRYRFLWFFGVFAAILGNGGEVQMLFRSDSLTNLPTNLNSLGQFLELNAPRDLVYNTWFLLKLQPALIIPLLLLFLLLLLFIVWLIMVSQAALVHSVARINSSKAVNFRNVFADTYQLAGPVFLLNFFTRLVLYGILVILSVPFLSLLVLSNHSDIGLIGLVLLGFIVLVPLAIIMNFILKYALVYLVADNEKVWPAFRNAFRLFWKNWFVSIEMGIIMFFINILVGLGAFVLLFFLMVPFLALVVLFSALEQMVLASLALVLVAVILIGVIVLVGSWLSVFQYSVWTLLFFELKRGRAYPKVMRLLARGSVASK